LSTIVLMM